MLPLVVLAAASTPPSTLVDLTTKGWGRATGYSDTYNNGRYNGTMAFDDASTTPYGNSRWLATKAANMYVTYKFNVATVVDAIQIFIPASGGDDYSNRAPKAWTFQGSNDNSSWDVLDTQDSETGWAQGDSRYYKFANTKAYQYYKFNCTALNGTSAKCLQLQEIEFYCIGTDSTWTGGGATDLLNDDANWGGSSMPGSNGRATINDSGSTPAVAAGGCSVYTALSVGRASGQSAKVVQTNGAVKVLGNLIIGDSSGVGEYVMTGGELSCAELHIGYASSGNGRLVVSGGVVRVTGGSQFIRVGRGSTGTLEVGGTGQLILPNELNIGRLAAGRGTVKLSEGGTITTTGVKQDGGKAELVEFDGGTLKATENNASFLKDLPNIQLKAGGLTINTQGKNLGINNCTFNVTGNGKITVTGGGTVTFTNVTLNMPSKPSGKYVFAETDGTFSGLPNLSGITGCRISLSDDSKRVTVSPKGFIITIF